MGNLPPGQWTWGIDVIVSFDYLDKHWFRFISYSKNKGEVLENMRYSYASELNNSTYKGTPYKSSCFLKE